MEPPVDLPPKSIQAEDKSKTVEAVTNADRIAYQAWINDNEKPKELDAIPASAARYLAIPKRLLETVDDPIKVGIVIIKRENGELDLLVVEHKAEPITNKVSFDRYLQDSKKFNDEESGKQKAQGKRLYVPPPGGPTIPPDVDKYHVKYADLIRSGVLTTSDYVTHHLNLRTLDNPEALYVAHYDDREELRGKGIASSFYERLPQVAKDMGFRYVVGWNEESNVGYFVNKLGRSRISEIKPEERARFGATQREIQGDTRPGDKIRTVEFLYPEDKVKYVV